MECRVRYGSARSTMHLTSTDGAPLRRTSTHVPGRIRFAMHLNWTQLITQAATGLSPETVRRGVERDRCGTALLGGSNSVTTRIVRRVSRKQFAVLDCGSDQHF